MLPTLEQTAK